MILLLTIFNALAFIIYGVVCLLTNHMVEEFTRYGLLQFRTLAGYLELFGGIGCVVGYYFNPYLYILSCFGLAILMTLGIIVRVRIGDPFSQAIPALILGLLNYFLVFYSLKKTFHFFS